MLHAGREQNTSDLEKPQKPERRTVTELKWWPWAMATGSPFDRSLLSVSEVLGDPA